MECELYGHECKQPLDIHEVRFDRSRMLFETKEDAERYCAAYGTCTNGMQVYPTQILRCLPTEGEKE